MINLTTTKAVPGTHDIQLAVTQDGMVVSVAGGGFKFAGQDHTLEQTDYTAEDVPNAVLVTGWLARETETGDVLLVVDENDGAGPYVWEGSPYEKLDILFEFLVPANTTSLDGVEITVRHLVPTQKAAKPPQYTDEELEALRVAGEAREAAREAQEQAAADALAEKRREQAAADRARREAERPEPEPEPPGAPSLREIHQAWQQAKERGEV